jgi:subtilisin family serine protease
VPNAASASSKVLLPLVRKGIKPAPCACVQDAYAGLASGDIIPGEYIVTMQDAAVRSAAGLQVSTADFADSVAAQYGGEVLFVYDAALDGFAVRITDEGAQAMSASPAVAAVEPNRLIRIELPQSLAEPVGEDRLPLAPSASFEFEQPIEIASVDATASWGIDRADQRLLPLNGKFSPYGNGANVHVYVLDSGLRGSHDQFKGRVLNGYTAINDGNDTWDCNGHGTHVAGTAAGSTIGVARNTWIHPVRVLDACNSGSNAGVIAGLNYVAANRRLPAVANMSLGGGANSSVDAAVRNVIQKGVTVVVAAGNDEVNACLDSPARIGEAITVAATDRFDLRADYSNWGTCVDLFAPGTAINSAFNAGDTAYKILNGTSMAAPHVTGAAALYLSKKPTATPAQVAQEILGRSTVGWVKLAAGSPNRMLYVGPNASQPPAAPLCANVLGNGGFEEGPVRWSQYSTGNWQLICTSTSCGQAAPPKSGNYFAWLGGAHSELAVLKQAVKVPTGGNAGLSFWYRINSTDSCGKDWGYVEFWLNGKYDSGARIWLCSSYNSLGWVPQRFDLSTYSGRTVEVVFAARTDSNNVSSLYVDNAAVMSYNNCVPVSTASLDEAGALPSESETQEIAIPQKTTAEGHP